MATQLLPSNPNLTQLKHQAGDLLGAWRRGEPEAVHETSTVLGTSSTIPTLAHALHVIAHRYSFSSWPRLKHFVDTSDTHEVTPAAVRLREAIDGDRLAEIAAMLDSQPDLIEEFVRRAGRSYQNQRPLVYACQANRLEIVRLLLERGADPTSDGYLAVARAALHDSHVSVLTLLLDQNIDPNIDVYDWGPLLLIPCETLAPVVLQRLIDRGADPNRASERGRCQETPLQMLIGTYGRDASRLAHCLEILIAAGATYRDSVAMDIHRGRIDALRRRLNEHPQLLHQPIHGLEYGITGGRALTASGGTMLHVAAEFCAVDVARFLIERGARIDARAELDAQGRGGQTPLFHAVAHYHDWGVSMTRLLLEHGANPNLPSAVRGHMDRPEDYVTCTPLGYARRFPPGRTEQDPTVMILKAYGARDEV